MRQRPTLRETPRPTLKTHGVCVLLILSAGLTAFANEGERPEYAASAYERICRAEDDGTIDLRQSVLARAELLFAPERIDPASPFAPQAGEVAVFEECLTGFYKDVHRAYPTLTTAEREVLSSSSPDLALLLRSRSGDREGGSSEGLPNYPELDRTESGKSCIVHYTLTDGSPHKVPNRTYAELVRLYMDTAIKKETKRHFSKALTEGAADFKGKVHVYVLDINGNGEWVDVTSNGGNRMAGYIKLSHSLKSDYGGTWQLKLKGVCAHEYFHGVQSAYNAWSDLWFLEGTAVWASCIYGNDWAHVNSYYTSPSSVFSVPDDVIWLTTYRKYSTSALAFHLHNRYRGWKFFKAYFEKSVSENDGIRLLKSTITDKGGNWDSEFRKYLACMYTRKLGVLKKQYIPKVVATATHGAYGVNPTNASVSLTGADFILMNPQAGAKAATFIATFETTASNPIPFLVKQGKTETIGFTAGKAHVGEFGTKAKQVCLIVTDCTYTARDAVKRSYKYSAIVPWIKVRRIDALSPIFSGQTSPIDITYDLRGTYPGETFPVDVKVVEKGPDVSDHVSGTYLMNVGDGQVQTFYFNTASNTHGTYKFTFQYKLPPDSWNMPQVKSKESCRVVVKRPPNPSPESGGTSIDGSPERSP